MIDNLEKLQNQKPKTESLLVFGFVQKGESYLYATQFLAGQFTLTVTIAQNRQ